MNYRNISLISSLIMRNYCKIISVSKYLFQQIKINKEYLEYIYNYFEDNEIKNIEISYLIKLYKELVKLNCKHSNIIFNTLHNNHYYYEILNLKIVEELVELKLINNKNFTIVFNNKKFYKLDIIKCVVSAGIYNKKKILIESCQYNNLELAKFLIEELNVDPTYKNCINICVHHQNTNLFKYIFSKVSKSNINIQELLYLCSSDLDIFKYLIEEMNVDIGYSTIEKIVLHRQNEKLSYLVEKRHIEIDFNIFCEAIRKRCLYAVKYLYRIFKYDISEVKDELIKYILNGDYFKRTIYNDYCLCYIKVNDVTICNNDDRYDILKLLLEIDDENKK